MARTGKIARLPRRIRDELNRRLDDGEPGTRLIAWLNSQLEVQQVLVQKFSGRPINKVNLSAWRRGGFQDSLTRRQNRLNRLCSWPAPNGHRKIESELD